LETLTTLAVWAAEALSRALFGTDASIVAP